MAQRRLPPALHQPGFTLVELLVVIAIIAILIAVLLPALSKSRVAAIQLKNNIQLRSIHQALVVHSNNNDTWYTGIDGPRRTWKAKYKGYKLITQDTNGTMPEVRFSELITLELLEAEVLIHPAEKDPKEVWQSYEQNGYFGYKNFSYAVNELGWDFDDPAYDQAQREWKNTGCARTPVVADRLYRIDGGPVNQWNSKHYIGMYNDDPGKYQVGIVWNDGHVVISDSAVVEDTQFGNVSNTHDNIYSRGDDQQEGNEQYGSPVDKARGSSAKFNAYQWESTQPAPR